MDVPQINTDPHRSAEQQPSTPLIPYPFSDADDSADDLALAALSPRKSTVGFKLMADPESESEGEKNNVSEVVASEQLAEQVKLSGFLKKRDAHRQIWRKRWFVLRSSRIAYYKNEKEYELLGVINVSDISAIAEVDLKRKSNVFGIVTAQKTFFIQALTAEEMDEWLSNLKAWLREFRAPSRNSFSTPRRASNEVKPQSILKSVAQNKEGAVKEKEQNPSHTKERDDAVSEVHSFVTGTSLLTLPSTPSVIAMREEAENDVPAPILSQPSVSFVEREGKKRSSVVGSPAEQVFSDDDDDGDDEEGETIGEIVDNRVIMQGYLQKYGGPKYNKSWKKRWLVLRNGALACYKDETEYVVSRLVPLRTVLEISEVNSPMGSKHPYCIKLVRPKRSLLVSCETSEEREKWMNALRNLHVNIMECE